jgi:predicted DNA-binding protein YlxM (UPF0122 family)
MGDLSYTVSELTEKEPISRQTVYDAINTRKLKAKKRGKSTIITVDDYREYLADLPYYEPAGEGVENA